MNECLDFHSPGDLTIFCDFDRVGPDFLGGCAMREEAQGRFQLLGVAVLGILGQEMDATRAAFLRRVLWSFLTHLCSRIGVLEVAAATEGSDFWRDLVWHVRALFLFPWARKGDRMSTNTAFLCWPGLRMIV